MSTRTLPSFATFPMCALTRPKMVCFPSSHGVGASVMKNCDPLVFGPLLAMDKTPAPVCFSSRVISSSNLPPNADTPPRPVPVGSPPWIMKSEITRWKGTFA